MVAEPSAGFDVPDLLERVEAMILGGARRYTADEVADQAQLSREEARRLWRALGFATVDDDDPVFTDADVTALRELGQLTSFGLADEQLRLSVTRMFGQVFARLASYQGQLLLEQFNAQPEQLATEDDVVAFVARLIPLIEHLQGYTWRRQLAAYVARMAAQGGAIAASGPAPVAVGFADLSGFTALTRQLSEAQLQELLEVFESLSTEIVGAHGGRIVKTIGDEVLFQVTDPVAAAQIALELVEAADQHPQLPPLRAGLAYGPVVSRLGDVYGSTVNIASRLTTIARRGWVLVDRELHDVLADDARFRLTPRRPEAVRGFQRLRPWRLRRAAR